MPGRVVVCGNVVFDISARPVEQVRWEATSLIDEVAQCLGGNGGSTSYTLARLGVPVSFSTLVGRDANADFVLDRLAGAGVDLNLVQRVEAPTSMAISLVRENGQRALLYHLGAASEVFQSFDFPADANHFHISAVFRMRDLRTRAPHLLKQARDAGLRTSLDTQWDTEGEWMKVLAPSLPFSDYTLMNEDEARLLTGHHDLEKAAESLRERGASHVIIKRGAAGCWADGETVPGYQVTAVDTTGAGDCFAGAFIAGLHKGMTLKEAARLANAVGALAVAKMGATSGVLDWNATINWLENATLI
jgi:sugar/nucleoside kinase (ribokinase family)